MSLTLACIILAITIGNIVTILCGIHFLRWLVTVIREGRNGTRQ